MTIDVIAQRVAEELEYPKPVVLKLLRIELEHLVSQLRNVEEEVVSVPFLGKFEVRKSKFFCHLLGLYVNLRRIKTRIYIRQQKKDKNNQQLEVKWLQRDLDLYRDKSKEFQKLWKFKQKQGWKFEFPYEYKFNYFRYSFEDKLERNLTIRKK